MDHDLTTAPGAAADGLRSGGPDTADAETGAQAPPRPRGARGAIPGQAGGGTGGASGAGGGAVGGDGDADGEGAAETGRGVAGASDPAGPVSTVRLASPGSVIASIPFLFGFHPDNSLVVLGISHSAEGGSFIRHGIRLDLEQVRGHERATALELGARLRDQDASIAILVAFGPRAATGAKARPDHCRKLMAAFRAQLEAAASEERVTVVDALYSANGRWWSYMCRNNRCCPAAGTVVPAEAPAALTGAFATRGHTVYASREALDATLDPHPPEILARTAAAAEQLDPAWYDTDAGLADARKLMDILLARCGDDAEDAAPRAARAEGPRAGRRGLSDAATAALSPRSGASSGASDPATGAPAESADTTALSPKSGAPKAVSSNTEGQAADGSDDDQPYGSTSSSHSSSAVIPAARAPRRVSNRVPSVATPSEGIPLGALAEPPSSLLAPPAITDAEAAELLIALLNWRVRDYLACAAATVDSAGRLLRLGAELARRAPHPDLRLAPYALAAWAAWAIGRPAIAQCAVDRALAIDPDYKFASLIRAGLHHAIDGEGVRESAASTRRDLFGEASVEPDATGSDSADLDDTAPDTAPGSPIPSPRSTRKVPTESDLEIP
jgi:hypothetical protein